MRGKRKKTLTTQLDGEMTNACKNRCDSSARRLVAEIAPPARWRRASLTDCRPTPVPAAVRLPSPLAAETEDEELELELRRIRCGDCLLIRIYSQLSIFDLSSIFFLTISADRLTLFMSSFCGPSFPIICYQLVLPGESAWHRGRTSQGANEPEGEKAKGRTSQRANEPKGEKAKRRTGKGAKKP